MLTWFRQKLLDAFMPVTRAAGKVSLPKRNIGSKEYRDIKVRLAPGMVFLTRTDWCLTNSMIPGAYKHGAIYLGDSVVIEALGTGVSKTDLIDFLLTKDRVRVMTPKFADPVEMADAAAFAETLVGRPYDYQFRGGNEAFYCFEVIYAAYREARIKRQERDGLGTPVVDWDLRDYMGEPTVVGDDFLRAKEKWADVIVCPAE